MTETPTIGVDRMVDRILRHEGGYVDHPHDRGGPTNFGITQNTLSEWRGQRVSREEVRVLTEDEAREIYVDKYFTAPKIDRLPGAIQQLVFDCSINHGPVRAAKFVQRVINEAGVAYLAEDGICGPRTQDAAAAAFAQMGDYLQNAIVEERKRFYRAIVRNDPSQNVFLRGWMSRADSFLIREPELGKERAA